LAAFRTTFYARHVCAPFWINAGFSGGFSGWRQSFVFVAGLFARFLVSGPASALISQAGQTPSLVRDHSPDFCRIRIADQSVGVEMAFALGLFGGQNMALESLAPFDLAGGGLLKSLGCAFVGL